MAYPTSYRRGAAGPQNARRNFWRDESGFLRFPDGRGTWENPTRPRRPTTWPSRPFVRPPPPSPLIPPDPATRPNQDIPWWERGRATRAPGFHMPLGRTLGWLGLAVGVSEMLWPGDQWRFPHVPPPSGWSHVCGPSAWPGPPYLQATRTVFASGICTTPGCGTGLQSIGGFSYLPDASSRCMRTYWGPHAGLLPAERFYLSDQYTVNPAANNVQIMAHYPVGVSSQLAPYLPPGVHAEVVAVPVSLWEIPATQTSPDPFGTTRANTAPDLGPAPSPSPSPNGRGLSYQPNYPEIRPRERERERKLDPRVGVLFKFFSQVGTWHSFVNALHRSLPPRYSHRRRTLQQKLQDIYQHYDEIDLDRAVRYLGQYWLKYKLAGWAYGRVQKELVRLLGPNAGMDVYRGLVNAGLI